MTSEKKGGAVHSPDHYTTGGIEAIDYIRAKLGADGFRAYCLGNVLKYVSRYAQKDGQQDLEKAYVYLGWAKATNVAKTEIKPASKAFDPAEPCTYSIDGKF